MGCGVVGARPAWAQRRASRRRSEPRFPRLHSGDNVSPLPDELVWGLNEQTLGKVSRQRDRHPLVTPSRRRVGRWVVSGSSPGAGAELAPLLRLLSAPCASPASQHPSAPCLPPSAGAASCAGSVLACSGGKRDFTASCSRSASRLRRGGGRKPERPEGPYAGQEKQCACLRRPPCLFKPAERRPGGLGC